MDAERVAGVIMLNTDDFTPLAKQALAAARSEALRVGSDSVSSEHLLSGLMRLEKGVASGAFKALNYNVEGLRLELEAAVIEDASKKRHRKSAFTPRVQKIVNLARKHAEQLGQSRVGTGHLLMGVVLEGASPAARALSAPFSSGVVAVAEGIEKLPDTFWLEEDEPVALKLFGTGGVTLQEGVPREEPSPNLAIALPDNRGECVVISVVSANGGVGKTVIATNLAVSLAKRSEGVVLLDFSLQARHFAVMLDDVPVFNLMDAVNAGESLNKESFERVLARHSRLGFHYLASPNHDFDVNRLDVETARRLVNTARELASFVVVDTGHAKSPGTLAAIENSDYVLLITTRDVARLLDAKRYVRFLKEEWKLQTDQLKLLVNQSDMGAEVADSEIERLIEVPVAAEVPSKAESVFFSINMGTPLVDSVPRLSISVALDQLAAKCFSGWKT